MNKLLTLIALVCLGSLPSLAQTKDHVVQAMDNLLGGSWELNGFWMDGNKFNQEFKFEKMGPSAYYVETFGNISKTGYETGLRNRGVRGWNDDEAMMKFSEIDVFGGITNGDVIIDGLDILYTYEYGGQTLTDAWIYKGPDMYEFIIGVRGDNGQWSEIQLNGGCKRVR